MGNEMPRCVWPEWEFVKRIGRGAYGTVYEAVRTDEYGVESRSAIKVISIPQDEAELDTLRTEGMDQNASKTYLRQVVDAFVNEVKLMIQLKGVPNIVSVEDYLVVEREEEIGWDISIRMELLTPLATYISDKTITEEEVARIGCDICSALEVCEKKNIIHRDIKPANIFVNEFGDFILGDFGIAKQMEGLTYDLSRKGTGAYMAPEVEKGESYNTTVDLYSLGLVLYYLLNKRRLPFNDPNKQILTPNERERAIRRRLDGETLPAPCDASTEMTGVIRCACAYNPQQRFRSANAMQNALQLLIKGELHAGQPKAGASAPVEQAAAQATSVQATPAQDEEAAEGKRRRPIRRLLIIIIIIVCVVVALLVVQRIWVDRYDRQVEQQVSYREGGDAAREEQSYEKASAMLPSRLESYYQHARTLHELPVKDGLPDYVGCINFIEDDILQNARIDQTQSRMADVYYLYADSLFQNGEYDAAVDIYRELFQMGTDQTLYYRDYAIALAYDGYYARADEILEEAQDKGLGDDNISYAKGEVEKAREEYDNAREEFERSIKLSEDEDLIARARLSLAEICEIQDDKKSAREELLEAENLDTEMLPQILQKLIQVDIDLSGEATDDATASQYRQEAIDKLQQVEKNGWETFTTYNNMIVLNQLEGDLTDAENILRDTKDQYESDYRWYMRAAFLEIEKQETLPIDERGYTDFVNDYNAAVARYDAYLEDGGTSDSEMGVLDTQYENVKNSGWLK